MAKLALGIDIGGGRIRAAAVDEAGAIRAINECETPQRDAAELALQVVRCARNLGREHDWESGGGTEPIECIGIALPGAWDRPTGIMKRAVNLPFLDGVNVRELFKGAFGRSVYLDSDVIAAGWAQWRAQAGQSASAAATGATDLEAHQPDAATRFVYVSLGTGIGGCVILDGQVVRHTRGGPGHVGHLIVDTSLDAPLCGCGARGCVEAIASGRAIEARRQQSDGANPPDSEFFAEAVEALATACYQIGVIYAPDVICFGGGVVDHTPELVTRVRDRFASLRSALIPSDLCIRKASLPTGEAGAVGAALLAVRQAP